MQVAEIAIVGTGAAAVHAAQTLTELGHSVTVIDVGIENQLTQGEAPADSFLNLRSTDPEQYKYFLGPRLESVTWGETAVGAQLTAARKFIVEGVDQFTPRSLKNFAPYESLALGGLGNGWGAGCFKFSDQELELAGMSASAMAPSYDTVVRRIGVSRPGADILKFTMSNATELQGPILQDSIFQQIQSRYNLKKSTLNNRGFYLGEPSLAILSRDLGERRAHQYRDMDFYSNEGQSIYRPQWTMQTLLAGKKITYVPQVLVTRIEESEDGVTVIGRNVNSREDYKIKAKKVILAAGVLGTSRIILRSYLEAGHLPLLCNSYAYYPSLYLPGYKAPVDARGHSLAQMMMFYDPDGMHRSVSTASIYGYRSLLLHRLIKETPLSIRASRRLFKTLQKMLVIFGIHHPDQPDGGVRRLSLAGNANSFTSDQLQMEFFPKEIGFAQREAEFRWAIRKLNCWPIQRVNPGLGSSIHYAGSLPFSKVAKPFHLNDEGRLHNAQHVYVADGSGIGFLPAKGITLTLMALGDRTARAVSSSLRNI